MNRIAIAVCLLFALLPVAVWAEMPYLGPAPSKTDHVYLVLGDRLVESEELEASQSEQKNRTVYTVSGASSFARTPLAEPAFLLKPGTMRPETLSLYQMKVEKGARSITFNAKPKKDDPRSIPLLFHPRKDGTTLIETNQFLEDGEYCLSPQGANTVFCFQVY